MLCDSGWKSCSECLSSLVVLVCLSFLLGIAAPWSGPEAIAAGAKSAAAKSKADAKETDLPEHIDADNVDAIIAKLSDEQVRSLLIRELRKAASVSEKKEEPQRAGFTGIILVGEETAALLRKRLNELEAGVLAVPGFLPDAYRDVRSKGTAAGILKMFIYLMGLFAAGVGGERLFHRYAGNLRKKLETTPLQDWRAKLRNLTLRSALDITSIGIFVFVNLLIYFIFLDTGEYFRLRRLILFTYLAGVLIVRGVSVLSHFILSPRASTLRTLPLNDAAASQAHAWIMRFAFVAGGGGLICALLEIQQVSEAVILLVNAITGIVVLLMIMLLLFENRQRISHAFLTDAQCREGAGTLRTQLAGFWPVLVVPFLLAVWGLWVLYLLLGRADVVLPILALLVSAPLYVVLNEAGQRILDKTFCLVSTSGGPDHMQCDTDAAGDALPASKDAKPPPSPLNPRRFIPFVRVALSLSIAGCILFWVLRQWGFQVHFGQVVTIAAFKILLVICLTYVAWRLIEEAITRKLAEIGGPGKIDEESDAGGAGGSRIGTLLLLLRKFLLSALLVVVAMIILSAVGVDIKPLLAGAGVVGLAVGFGAQTLVKDIISGIFFLIDDAFRIGDYVEAGDARGTVEHISIRSLRLRHHRGPVLTIPFSGLKTIKNHSRDYVIMKLEFRVPYDTDVEKVRKIVKKINKEIESDEEIGSKLLDSIKSQGVKELGESALVMRIKFKTIPGEQFVIRREVYSRLQKEFKENNIEFAHRHVIVQLPQNPVEAGMDSQDSQQQGKVGTSSGVSEEAIASAGAAAAIAAALAEEENKEPKK